MFVALIMGMISGLRAMVPLAAVSWAARLGILNLDGSWLAFIGYRWTPWIFTFFAIAELVNDKLPQTPSRKVPAQFATRVISGTLAGLVIGAPVGGGWEEAISGAIGAVLGTLAGAASRSKLVQLLGGVDLPIALLEDCIAVGGATFLVAVLR